MSPLYGLVAVLLCCCRGAGAYTAAMLKELEGNPARAATHREHYYQEVHEKYSSDPDGYQVLGLVEFYSGNLTGAYAQYRRCAEMGRFSEDYKHCVFNIALLLRRNRIGENNAEVVFAEMQVLLNSAPQFRCLWELFAVLMGRWAEAADSLSEGGRAAVLSIARRAVPVGLSLYPDLQGLSFARGVVHMFSDNPQCAWECMSSALKEPSEVAAQRPSYYDYAQEALSRLNQVIPSGDPWVEGAVGCGGASPAPPELLLCVPKGQAVSDVTGDRETYILAMLRLSKELETYYYDMTLWKRFVDIHISLLEHRDRAGTLLKASSDALFGGPWFTYFQRLGISLYPKHEGLLFLQGVQYYYRRDLRCARYIFEMVAGLSEWSHRDVDGVAGGGSALHDILRKAIFDEEYKLNNSGVEEDRLNQCYPVSHFDKCSFGQSREEGFRWDDFVDWSSGSVCHKEPQFSLDINDDESLSAAISDCNLGMPAAPSDLVSFSFDNFDSLVTPLTENDYSRVVSFSPTGRCRIVQLGCSYTYCVRPGWISVDAQVSIPAHVVADAQNLRTAFVDQSISLLYASHILEHVSKEQAKDVLAEWRRVLTPGGIILLAVPDIEAILSLFAKNRSFSERELLIDILYGGHDSEFNVHHTGYFFESLKRLLQSANFCNVRRLHRFGLFSDSSEFGIEGNKTLSLNVVATAC